MSEYLSKDNNVADELMQRLSKCPIVTQYGRDEPEILVRAFADLEESFHKFLDEQLPKILDSSVKGDSLEELLDDVAEEFVISSITYTIRCSFD